MHEIKEWAAVLCCAAVFVSAIEVIAPSGSYKKLVKLTLSAVTVLVMLAPLCELQKINIDISLDLKEMQSKSERVENAIAAQTDELVQNMITSKIASIARNEGIGDCRVDVVTNIDKNGSITIEQIKVELLDVSDEECISGFKKAVSDSLGIVIEIVG